MSDLIIRAVRPEDAEAIQETRTQPNARWGTLQLPTLTVETVREQTQPNPQVLSLVAEVGGRVVGQIGLHPGFGRTRHTAGLGMMVHDAFQGRGIGKRLMAAALEIADQYLALERVSLEVYPDNPRAVQLYRNFGFAAEGSSRKDSLRDGEFVSSLHMARLAPTRTCRLSCMSTRPGSLPS